MNNDAADMTNLTDIADITNIVNIDVKNRIEKSEKPEAQNKSKAMGIADKQNSVILALPAERPTVKQIEREIKRIQTGREIRKSVSGTVKNIIVLAAAVVLIANLVISVLVSSRSGMNPTLKDGDIIITSRVTAVKPGDVAAFYYNNQIMVKRVIAKAGDWVNIDPDGTVYVNNNALAEPYINAKNLGNCDIDLPYQVPDGCVFVMGDDRANSLDSRLKEMGPVSASNIIGKVMACIWPPSAISYLG